MVSPETHPLTHELLTEADDPLLTLDLNETDIITNMVHESFNPPPRGA